MNKGQEAAQAFMQFINGASRSDIEAFAKEVTSDHRTLQQSAFATFMRCVENWAENEHNGRYDGRNEMTVKSSKRIVTQLDMDTSPETPLFLNGKLLGLPYI